MAGRGLTFGSEFLGAPWERGAREGERVLSAQMEGSLSYAAGCISSCRLITASDGSQEVCPGSGLVVKAGLLDSFRIPLHTWEN